MVHEEKLASNQTYSSTENALEEILNDTFISRRITFIFFKITTDTPPSPSPLLLVYIHISFGAPFPEKHPARDAPTLKRMLSGCWRVSDDDKRPCSRYYRSQVSSAKLAVYQSAFPRLQLLWQNKLHLHAGGLKGKLLFQMLGILVSPQ